VDLRVRHRAEVTEKKVETERFAETEKIIEKQIKNRIMLMVFFDCHGIVHHEFAPEGKNVYAVFYVEVLKRLKDHVRRMDRNCGRGGNLFSTTNMPHTLCINRASVFGPQFHHRA